jgi:hypothetical protein
VVGLAQRVGVKRVHGCGRRRSAVIDGCFEEPRGIEEARDARVEFVRRERVRIDDGEPAKRLSAARGFDEAMQLRGAGRRSDTLEGCERAQDTREREATGGGGRHRLDDRPVILEGQRDSDDRAVGGEVCGSDTACGRSREVCGRSPSVKAGLSERGDTLESVGQISLDQLVFGGQRPAFASAEYPAGRRVLRQRAPARLK